MEELELFQFRTSKFFFLYSIGSSGENDEDDDEHDLERIDIPRSLLDTRKYCATLGHKGKLKPEILLLLLLLKMKARSLIILGLMFFFLVIVNHSFAGQNCVFGSYWHPQ